MGFSALLDGMFDFLSLFSPLQQEAPTNWWEHSSDGLQFENALVTGATRSGKSTSMLAYDIMPTIQARECAVAIYDPHRTLGLAAAAYTLERGMADRLFLLDLTKKELGGWGFLMRSRHSDPFERTKENREFARGAADAASLHRGAKIDDTRIIKEWFLAACTLWQEQRTDVPPLDFPWCLRPGTAKFDSLLLGCTEEETRAKFEGLKRMQHRLYEVVGPTARLIEELWNEPVIRALLVQTHDLEEQLRRRKVIVILGSGQAHIDRMVMRLHSQRCTQIVMKNFFATERELWLRKYTDEASRLVGEMEADNAGKTLKMGESNMWISQTNSFGDPLIDVRMEENTFEKIMFHAGSQDVAKRNAGHLTLKLDPNKIHHTTPRQLMDGYEEVEMESTGESKDADGHVRKDKRKGKSLRARHRDVEDPHYQSLNEQGIINEQQLMELDVGECFIRRGPKLYGPLKIDMLPPPFTFDVKGAYKKYVERHRLTLVAAGLLREPVEAVTPCPTPQPAKPANGQPKKKRTKGMRRS